MKQLLLLLGLTVFLLPSATLQAQNRYTKPELQAIYGDMLSDLGLTHRIDSDGDVQFVFRERTYFIGISDSDPHFFRIALFNVWPIESAAEMADARTAIDRVNGELKVAKIYTVENGNGPDVWISVEMFVEEPTQVSSQLKRCLEVMDEAVRKFISLM
ncbi:hypothetical protein [Pontibacter sp. G13]|uniref:hypothetical protein n=1 Tax=Pontibacter sp. G13 TaxID=3074898 RepID=UPI00288B01D4|nr:hypothetical protein [Pontibacter sp. G13]WNJ17098.1 hypothetical protein RJD25_19765 [Pontibacter sp. G13]